MISEDNVGHVWLGVEQRHLRAKSWVALDCVSNAVIFVDDEVIGKDSIDLQLLGEAVGPGLDLLVVLVVPVEAGGSRLGAGVETDLAANLNLASRPHCSINESLDCPWVVFCDRVAVLSDFLQVVLDGFVLGWESKKVKTVHRVVVDVFQNESMLMFELGSIFLNSLFKNFVNVEYILIGLDEEGLWDSEAVALHELTELMLVAKLLEDLDRSVEHFYSELLELASDLGIKLLSRWGASWDEYLSVVFFANLYQFFDVVFRLGEGVWHSAELGNVLTESTSGAPELLCLHEDDVIASGPEPLDHEGRFVHFGASDDYLNVLSLP